MIELFEYSLSGLDLAALVLVALLIGMGKTGIAGAGMIAVPVLALIFGGKASTGLLLPILIYADLMAVSWYHRHANWQHLRRLLPWALLGVVFGTLTGELIDEASFIRLMALIIFASLALMIWQERQPAQGAAALPESKWFVYAIGVLGGFTTMVGNLAGPIMALYLLAQRFPKNEFIGTAAWFFLLINLLKVPFHIFAWHTISLNSLMLDTILLPAIALGAWLGVVIVQRIPESAYRYFVILMTAVAALAMLA
ncbi:MAG: sulfite exporter TauE/SafE family protein [Gammaproteobacteria bacterium]|nr:sulfite exporter TauE/SafE family protein [Gammaproteobacteria bacterium]